MLPDMDGLTVLRRLRERDPDVPVLFLTARDAVEDRVAGLTAGGDDYVTKPFSLEEVVARLRGLLRRGGANARREDSVLVVGDLELDEDAHEVRRGARRSGSPRPSSSSCGTHAQPAPRAVQGADPRPRLELRLRGQANIVELYISYLRRKIDKGRAPMIHTLRGVGYVLKPAPDAESARA